MSGRLFRGTSSRRDTTVRGRARTLLVLGGTVALGAVLSVVAQAATPPAFDATAKITPGLYYVNDTQGSYYTFTVTNTGSSAGIGAVEIRRPSTAWSVSGCLPPAGWTSQRSTDKCRFVSAASTSDDLKPGKSMTFKVGAKTAPGNVNQVGTWPVVVSKSNHFATPSLLRYARSTGSGLSTVQHVFELTTAVVSDTLKAAGTSCPPAAKDAVVGTTTNVVVCGRNRGNVALAPTSAYSSLSGTFLKTTGTFSSGTIQPNSGDVVLARWSGAVVSEAFGSGKKVVTHVGSASNRTSPLRTFTGYNATSKPPVAVDDVATTDEDTTLNVAVPGVLGNDTNAEAGETLTAVDVTQPAHGTVTLSPDGSYSYVPHANFAGTDSFTYKTFDTYSKSASATVTITVTPVNDAPVAEVVTTSTPEDTAKVVILGGSDVDSPSLSYTIVSDPSHGTLGAVVGNAVTYTPAANYNGSDSFTYKVNDGSLDSAAATVNLTVDAVNDAPAGTPDSVSVGEDAAVAAPAPGILGNDTDVEGSPLTATLVAGPAHAQSFTLNPDGGYSYAPVADYTGTDSFTYKASDGDLDSALTTVTITVDAANDAPTAAPVSVQTTEDTAKAVTLVGADVDGDTPVYSIVTPPAHGSLGAVSGDSVTYTPDANYFGADSFTYKVNDGTADSAAATVTIDVVSVNDVPVAAGDDWTTDEDTTLTVPAPGVLGDDSDVESPLTAQLGSGPSHGTLTLNPDGSFTYTPAANYFGTDSFTYTANDGEASSAPATVEITIDAVNDAPSATAASVSTPEDTAKTVTLAGTDVEGSALTFAVVTGPAHGSLGAISGNEVVYTPDANYNGPDSFTFKANDGAADSAAATISIAVDAVNDAPVQVDDSYVTNEDTALNVVAPGVLANDFDVDNDALTAALVSGPSHGTLTLNGNGSFTYTPSANYNGPDSFTYKNNDGTVDSAVATVTLSVDPVNDAPATSPGSATTTEDTAKEVSLSGADPVEGSPVTFAIVSGPSHGSLGAVSGNKVTYTPDADYNGTDSFTFKANDGGLDSNVSTFTLTVTAVNDAPSFTAGPTVAALQDSGAFTASGWATAISKGPADESGQTLTFAVVADDTALFSVQPAVDAATGDLTFTPAPGVTGETDVSVTLSDNGGLVDGGVDTSAPQIVKIKIVPPNATPVAAAKTASGSEDGGAIPVTLTAVDDDGDALTFAAGAPSNGVVTPPAGTSCDANVPSACTATVTYTPNQHFFGTDTFTYTVNDGTIDSAAVTVTVTVNPVNDAPSFTKGADQFVNEDSGARTVAGWATNKSAGPANESGQVVTYEVTGTTNDALFSVLPAVSPAGDLTYTPAPNANGAATVSVRAVDDGGGTNASPVQTFSISVLPVNDAPSFAKGADQNVNEDAGAQSVSLWATAISKGPADESAQTLSFTTSNDNNGLFSVQPGVTPTGTLVYTPAPNAVGSATVTITLSDNGGTANGGADTSGPQTFTITVGPVNDAPSFTTAGNQTVLEDAGAQTVNGFVTSASPGPGDEAAQAVTVAVTNHTNPALFSAAPAISNGTLTYTPAPNANGVSTVTVRATDDGGTANGGADTSPTQTFTIAVTPVNDAPSFTKGADQAVNEDAGAKSISGWAGAISAGASDEAAQTLAFTVTNDNNGLFSAQPAVSPTGTLTFTPAANKYGAATVTVTLADNGGTANGGADTSAPQTFTITVDAVNDAPVAAAKSYDVQTNMKRSVGGLLTGATDPNDVAGNASWSPTFTVGSVTAGANCVGCTISNVDNAAGTFDFEPPAGQTGTFSVTYTVVDDGHPAPGATSAPQTITFTVSGDVIWFVDNANGVDGAARGTLTRPFKTLAAVAAVDTANHMVFLSPGTYTDAYTAQTASLVAGAGAKAADFDALFGVDPPAGTAPRPAVNGTNPTVSGALTLGSNNTLRGVTLAGSTALGGTSFGTLTLGNNAASTADVVVNTAGQALNLATGTVNGDFVSVTSTGGTNNVSLSSVATTSATSLGTGALSGATQEGLKISGGTGSFSYGGTVTNGSASPAVLVTGKSAGTTTLSGLVSSTAGKGIELTSNTGAVNAFTGGVALTSTTNPAFVATGGGTVTVTGAANTISSTTGTALNIANTTIGAADVTFRSISANGAANGIVLNNTGNTGNLAVTGTGSAATGGTIANTTGTGVSLTSTRDVALGWMKLQNTGGDGIAATTVTNLALTSLEVLGAGDADEERSLDMVNVGGTITINDGLYDDSSDDIVKLKNSNLNATVTVNNTATFSNQTQTNAGNVFDFAPDGTSAFAVSITNSTFSNLKNTSVNFGATTASSSGSSTLTFSNNSVSGGAGGAGGVTVSGQENTQTTVTIASNTFTGAGGNGVVNHDVNDNSTVLSTVSGNTFTSPKGHAIVGAVDENGDIRMNVTNNQISNAGGDGIELTNFGDDSASSMTSTAHWIVTNNTVNGHSQTSGVQFVGGIGIFHFEADADTSCAKVTGNTVGGTPAGYSDIYLQDDSGAANRMVFEEVPDTAATGDASEAYIFGLNPNTTVTNIANLGASYSNGVACTMP